MHLGYLGFAIPLYTVVAIIPKVLISFGSDVLMLLIVYMQ